ncbi:MAG: sigma-54 dependent transcriptional regulator [Bacteroidales bacterium]|nr:sigma-54 dependent transcriptional regulator [Bacteroidales bacterium]
MNLGRILIIDDEEKLRSLLRRILELEKFETFEAADSKTAFKKLEQHDVDVVLCDVKLPDADGVELSHQIKTKYPLVEIIILTAYGNIPDSVKAIKHGAFDYITKGDDNDKIIPLIHRALEKVKLQKRLQRLEKHVEKFSLDGIIGTSKPIIEAIELAKKVAPTDATVLLFGETGTGKELFSQSIHNASSRKDKPFVDVNCSAFPKELLESEVFGHKKGAFTGANYDKKGLFEEANEGTLFLDEIGDMHVDLQGKLLRFLETQTFTRVGETKPTHVNVRIIAATNKNLENECKNGNFREDLYYRLSVFKIRIPSLIERKEDIELLANHFIDVFSTKIKKNIKGMDKEFFNKLINYKWKGNTRELKNIIERAVILAEKNILTVDLLPFEISDSNAGSAMNIENASLADIEKSYILKVLSLSGGNKSKAAEKLGIGLTTLYRKLEQYQIE